MKAGLLKAISSNIKEVICYSNYKSLIDAITGKKTVVALRGILHDLGVLSSSFFSISFKFIHVLVMVLLIFWQRTLCLRCQTTSLRLKKL